MVTLGTELAVGFLWVPLIGAVVNVCTLHAGILFLISLLIYFDWSVRWFVRDGTRG